jgi:hypothetical protein
MTVCTHIIDEFASLYAAGTYGANGQKNNKTVSRKITADTRKIACSGNVSVVIPLDNKSTSDLYFVGFTQRRRCAPCLSG